MATNQKQIGALLKAVIAKGVDTKDAVPTIKKLIEARIFDLSDLTADNVPASIEPIIRNKLVPKKKRGGENDRKGGSPTKRSKSSASVIEQPPVTTQPETILINRSPVLILWATTLARILYKNLDLSEALSLGSAVATQLAKAKGTSLGIYDKDGPKQYDETSPTLKADVITFEILGMNIDAVKTDSGIRAKANGQLQNPNKTWALLNKRFQDGLGFVMELMEEAAKSAGSVEELRASAYRYYMHIRPDIPEGTKGWGAHGRLETYRLSNFYDSKPSAVTRVSK
jgi:hypothetical protein